jgi:hypothetical protein
MTTATDISNQFPPTRERTILLELLRVVRILQSEGMKVVVCGGWVPFLKELARHPERTHSMSLDIDLLLWVSARERELIDRIGMLLIKGLEFEQSKTKNFRYTKTAGGNIVELDLLTDLPRNAEEDAVMTIQGINTFLDLCIVD